MRPLKMTVAKRKKVDTMLRNRIPVSTIAAKVGISAPTIYAWFPGGVRGMAARVREEERQLQKIMKPEAPRKAKAAPARKAA